MIWDLELDAKHEWLNDWMTIEWISDFPTCPAKKHSWLEIGNPAFPNGFKKFERWYVFSAKTSFFRGFFSLWQGLPEDSLNSWFFSNFGYEIKQHPGWWWCWNFLRSSAWSSNWRRRQRTCAQEFRKQNFGCPKVWEFPDLVREKIVSTHPRHWLQIWGFCLRL